MNEVERLRGLLPCPFCGSPALLKHILAGPQVRCDKCFARGPAVDTSEAYTDDDHAQCELQAIEAWNLCAALAEPQGEQVPAQDEREAFKRALHSQKVFKLSSATVDAAEWAWFARAIRPAQAAQQPVIEVIWTDEPGRCGAFRQLGHYSEPRIPEGTKLYAAPIAQTAKGGE